LGEKYRGCSRSSKLREKQPARSCDYEAYEGQDLGYADIQVVARNPQEVRPKNTVYLQITV
jgi:hypothetical protein